MTKEEFLKGVGNWDNHRYWLWPALEATTGTVVEFGIGHGSTPMLNKYCTNRKLLSYETDAGWLNEFSHLESENHKFYHVKDWNDINLSEVDILLIDHAPGERRWEDIKKYANIVPLIVIHDSEPAATGYMLEKIWHLFKYRNDYKTEGAWASIVSNFVDVTKWEV